ncbi:aromatic ring-hydroxylating dioxygenase subunit alpha [Pacificibacter marinus]|uniref:aromatic ring-hydroxylating dioxygenase subunit alpha n=1 Tax=Pacificibacter marinus TaxID=658057 RepID=UPI001C076F89|nr:aromatic ring-hydroxylating dioxygenase subunit alpha [Pacificibacter marinus]MBU2867819.1 aromatic ring-hydroxylating dioxygenase subunit alpha [Pacificibacter marinus]
MTTLVRNAWYVAAWSSEIDDELRRFVILGDPVLLYRRGDGTVAALEDRCPHRLLPLSKGKRIGDAVQCGYHGLTFGSDGKCTRVPGQDKIPPSAYVEAYPTEERHGIVWIWMGDAHSANTDDIFDLPQFSDPNWHAHHGDALHLESNYLNVAENLVDPAHVSFVHPTTLGNSASENVPVHVSTEGKTITAWRWIRDAEPIGFFKAFGGFTGNVDRWHYYHLYVPSIAVIDFGSADVADKIKEDDRDSGNRIFALHFMTPVTENYTIDRWMHLRNTAVDTEEASEKIDAMFRIAFGEDKEILEAVHAEEQAPLKRRPIRIAVDRGPMVYRKRINALLERERTVDAASEPDTSFIYHD